MDSQKFSRNKDEMDQKEIVLVHALGREEGKYDVGELYTVDVRSGQVAKCSGSVPLLKDNSLTRMCVLGSNVYILGGYFPPSPLAEDQVVVEEDGPCHFRISRLNLSDPDKKWESLPPFACPDIQANCIPYCGKIYLFRGLGYYNDSRFTGFVGEVFDPCLQTWKELIPPGPYLLFDGGMLRRVSYPAVLDSKNKRILVHFAEMDVLYAYYPEGRYWEPVVFMKDFCIWDSRVILLDDVLYFYFPQRYDPFVAYDLRNRLWPVVTTLPPAHFDTELLEAEFDSIYHVRDNTVCLAAWSPDDDPGKTRLVFVKFSIERTSKKQITVTPLHSQTHYMDKPISVNSFLPI